ncbi:hypothetical protein ACHAXR_011610 [Thalassiosira sp. AJA248-18]
MASCLWRTASAKCSRPSFISLHRPRALSLVSSTDGNGGANGPVFSRRKIHLERTSLSYHAEKSTLSRPSFLRASHTNASSLAPNANKLDRFSWPRLIDLFRTTPSNAQNNHGNNNYIPSDHPNLPLFRRTAAAQAYEEHKKYLNNYWMSAYDFLVVSKFGEEFGFEKVIVNNGDGSELKDGCNHDFSKKRYPPNGHIFKASPSLSQASKYTIENGLTYLKLVLNDFPYDLDEDIEHWCLWKIGRASSTEGISKEELSWALKELESLQADPNSGSGCIINQRDDPPEYMQKTRNSPVENSAAPISDTFYWVNPPALQSMPGINHAHILVSRSDLATKIDLVQ